MKPLGAEPSEVEIIKEKSDYLRGTIAASLADSTDKFSEEDKQLIKFHGMYQQKDRDKRKEGESEKTTIFMLRGRIPGGRLTAEQYLAWDHLASRFGIGSLRLTTRQSIQLHGLKKPDLKEVMREINRVGLSSMGACGDVVRNVTEAINADASPLYNELSEYTHTIANLFRWESSAYVEIWLDNALQNPVHSESIFGKTYLPRKFKIALTVAGDNGGDIYTNDLAFAATHRDGKINGFFVFAGGGQGVTHNKPETFPRAADLVGHIRADLLAQVATAIVGVHRDFGNRSDRRHARLKYILAEKGVEWLRSEVEKNTGITFDTERLLPEWKIPNYHGFIRRQDGLDNFGLYIASGRISDRPGLPLKSAIREVVRRLELSVQITHDQDLFFLAMDEAKRTEFTKILQAHGVHTDKPNPLYQRALSCVSLPTCGLALTEAERNFPHVLRDLNHLIAKHGLMDRAPLVRMTGCPNGCARPYSAEIGIVGQQNGGKYALFLGGNNLGTRVGEVVLQKIPMQELPLYLERAFFFWKAEGSSSEMFGDFVNRVGIARVKAVMEGREETSEEQAG